MRIVVIGGSGNAGSAIVRALARRGADVAPMSRSGKAIAGAPGVKADIVTGEGLDEAALAPTWERWRAAVDALAPGRSVA